MIWGARALTELFPDKQFLYHGEQLILALHIKHWMAVVGGTLLWL